MADRCDRDHPELFDGAVAAAPDAEWVVTDDGSWTFADAGRGRSTGRRRTRDAAGVGHGDRVIVTARNEPRYLFTWFALMQIGAVQVPLNPASSDGRVRWVRPPGPAGADRHRRRSAGDGRSQRPATSRSPTSTPWWPTDGADAHRATVRPDDLAVFIPTSGTTGRSKLVMQTHRAYAWAGTSFPWWMQLTADDRLMTSLPLFHINAPAYSVLELGHAAHRSRPPAPLLRHRLPRCRRDVTERPSSTRSARCSRSSCASQSDRTTPTTRCDGATRGRRRREQRQREIEERFGIEIVCGYALSESPFGFIWRHGSDRSVHSGGRVSIPCSATSTRPGSSTTTARRRRRRGRRAAAPEPGRDARLLRDARRDRRGRRRRRMAAHR